MLGEIAGNGRKNGQRSSAEGRVDERGRAYAGSQLQIQIYVNRRQEELSRAVQDELPSLAALKPRLRWGSPLESERFIEYQDLAFLRAVGLDRLRKELGLFWPKGGPHWDALAVVEADSASDTHGMLLVEAKSYPDEMRASGCQASPGSRKKIESALQKTKKWLGVPKEADWTGALYQSANRLAHLYFFLEIAKMPAWLANVCFLDDPRSPTTRGEWEIALARVSTDLGLTNITIPNAGLVFLEAGKREELLKP